MDRPAGIEQRGGGGDYALGARVLQQWDRVRCLHFHNDAALAGVGLFKACAPTQHAWAVRRE
jgi:hypothetical protein